MRVRLIYAKRGGACFVPHIALAQMFTRSATRAGFTLAMTQGFSPRAKISFGPELPAGVVALNEPVDMYFADDVADVAARMNAADINILVPTTNDTAPDVVARMNSALPEGFRVSRAIFPPDDAPNLGKMCKSAEYLLRSTTGINLTEHVADFWGEAVIFAENFEGWQRVIVSDPAQNPIGGLVRHLVSLGMIAGWHEVNVVRVAVGLFDPDTRSLKL